MRERKERRNTQNAVVLSDAISIPQRAPVHHREKEKMKERERRRASSN